MRTEGAVEMVRRGYDEETRCLGFRVEFYNDLDGACEAVRVIDQYNDFRAERVEEALRSVAPYLGPFGRAYVGREGSPVIYLDFNSDVDRNLIEGVFRASGADEVDFEENTLRAWWD